MFGPRGLSVVAGAALLVTLVGCGSARQAALEVKSVNNMKQIILEAHTYKDRTGEWPEGLAALTEQNPGLAPMLKNPITGDDPGYEFVKPTEAEPGADTPLLYQLRGGQRDESLGIGYADASVRKPGQ